MMKRRGHAVAGAVKYAVKQLIVQSLRPTLH
ncbi:hypothetical protein SAMN05414139_05591 [Burkholderia sp. D7]|nr:hypothetical protein SAMN05414139_05591 [Burkholderia sp. D7]